MTLPNLFQFATSELSQDAFICWLVSWANKQYENSHAALHQTALSLLDRFLELAEIPKPTEYRTVEVGQQFEKIDVFVRLNNEICVVIEDKTHTDEHSNQLTRYLDSVRKKFPNDLIAAIYFKTGDQSNYRAVEEAGFRPFRRQDFLSILDAGTARGVESDIFLDYFRRLQDIDVLVGEYVKLPISQWHSDCWIGFFLELQKRLDDGEWGYVPNRSGGFMGFWWHVRGTKFLLLEQQRLCFKVEVTDKAQQSTQWEEWHAAVMNHATMTGLSLKRPRRRAGTWMTVTVLEGDYRQVDDQGLVDLDRTLAVLRRAEALMDSAAAQLSFGTNSDSQAN